MMKQSDFIIRATWTRRISPAYGNFSIRRFFFPRGQYLRPDRLSICPSYKSILPTLALGSEITAL